MRCRTNLLLSSSVLTERDPWLELFCPMVFVFLSSLSEKYERLSVYYREVWLTCDSGVRWMS